MTWQLWLMQIMSITAGFLMGISVFAVEIWLEKK